MLDQSVKQTTREATLDRRSENRAYMFDNCVASAEQVRSDAEQSVTLKDGDEAQRRCCSSPAGPVVAAAAALRMKRLDAK
jgi:hypothetical protein